MRMLVLGLAVVGWNIAGAPQVLQPKANAGSGVVTVEGAVRAAQEGEWKVAVANTPAVHVANVASVAVTAPEFVTARGSYEVTWPDGTIEKFVVQQIGRDGWVRVESDRWLNLLAARSLKRR